MVKEKFAIKFSLGLCSLLLASPWAYAQENSDSVVKLDEVSVKETAIHYAAPLKASVQRTPLALEDTPKSVQVFTESFMEEAQLQNIEDAIQFSSNTVYLGDNHGRSNQIAMRGFSGVPVLIDGLKVTNKLAHPELYNFEAIEVQKGADSLQYGESSPGGLVNLVKKKPTKETFAKMDFEATDNPSYGPKLDMGGALNQDKSLYFRFTSAFKYDEGFTNNTTDTKRIFIAPSVAYELNENHTLTFVLEHTNETTPSSFGTYINSQGKFVAPIKNTISHPDEKFKKRQTITGFDVDSHLASWTSLMKYRYIDYVGDNGDVHMPQRYNEVTNRVSRAYAYQKQELQEHALQYTLNKEMELFGFKNSLSVGADYNRAYSKLDMFYDPFNPYLINPAHPNYESLTGRGDHPLSMNMSRGRTQTTTWGAFLQDSLYFTDALIISAGVRFSETKPQNGQKSDATTPSFGIVYKMTPQTSFYASYSESFTPNSATDVHGKVLDPETGKGIEAGMKQKLFDERVTATVALFKIDKENIAMADPNFPLSSIASGKQESRGFEVDMGGDITPDWSMIASYGYTQTKNKDKNNNDLRNAPKHTAAVFTTYKLTALGLPSLYIGGGARYIGERYADDANAIKLDSAVVYNATVGYKKKNWRAAISVQNLTNEKYVEGAFASSPIAGTRVYAGKPRTVLATLGYVF